MKTLTVSVLFFALSLLYPFPEARAVDHEPIGPTPIRFYSGNLSVGLFMHYWGTRDDGNYDAVHGAMLEQLQRTSCSSMCDYLSWCCAEREPGHWDFSFYETNQRRLAENGIGYNVFCWLHFPPRWYEAGEAFVPYENLETGETIPQLSLWSPDLPRIYDRFYERLAHRMADRIDFVRLAMPSEYGELGYCTGMTNWLRPQEHARPGYWCGDPHARADFRRAMLARYASLEALNAAWDTAFVTVEDIAPPDPAALPARFADSAPARRRWVDFVDWYNQAWVHCLSTVTEIVRRHLPDREAIASLGYGSEAPRLGNDEGRHIEAMARLGLAAQTPGDIGFFPTRRVSSACRHYRVPYFTEPPGNVPPDRQLSRIFMDACNGTQTWFDYLQNLDASRDLLRRYKAYLTGAPPRTTVAVWHPTLDHWLHPDWSWSEPALRLSDVLRDAIDYEIVDDRMIRTGALDTLNVRQLILHGATWLDAEAWRAVGEWIETGGVLLVTQRDPAADLDGDTTLWDAQAPASVPRLLSYLEPAAAGVPAAYAIDLCSPTADGCLIGSWYAPEPLPQGCRRWSGVGAGVILPVAPRTRYRIVADVDLPAQAAPVRLALDGRTLAEIAPGSEGPIALDWTSGDAPCATLSFVGDGWVPAEAGDSPDTRRLLAYASEIVVRRHDAGEAALEAVPAVETRFDADRFWRAAAVARGKGAVLTYDPEGLTLAQQATYLARLCGEAGTRTGRPEWDAQVVDGAVDGVLCTVFDDKVLVFNSTHEPRFARLRVGGREVELAPAPRTILHVPLRASGSD